MASRYNFIETITNPGISQEMKGFASNTFINSFLDGNEEIKQIPNGFQYRPDKLADFYYGDSKYYWILSYVNRLENPIEDYIVGNYIIVPSAKTVRNVLGE